MSKDQLKAFEVLTVAGERFWALGPNEDYWTSFEVFTDGTHFLYVEEETEELTALTTEALLERYDQFKPIDAMHEVSPGMLALAAPAALEGK